MWEDTDDGIDELVLLVLVVLVLGVLVLEKTQEKSWEMLMLKGHNSHHREIRDNQNNQSR